MTSEEVDRINRLVGDGKKGGGFPLPSLFSAILNTVQDNGMCDVIDLVDAVKSAYPAKQRRLEAVYPKGDPWIAHIQDGLDQLTAQGILTHKSGHWVLGPKFVTKEAMVVVPKRRGKNSQENITVFNKDERSKLGIAEEHKLAIGELLYDMKPDGKGFRATSQSKVEEIAESMRIIGYRPDRKMLVDQHGRILDGRHRMLAAKSLGLNPLEEIIQVEDDEETIKLAWHYNVTEGWSKKDRERVAQRINLCGIDLYRPIPNSNEKRDIIKKKILEDTTKSNKKIAEKAGVSRATVAAVRKEVLEEGCQNGSDSIKAEWPEGGQETAVKMKRQGISVAKIAKTLGVTKGMVSGITYRERTTMTHCWSCGVKL